MSDQRGGELLEIAVIATLILTILKAANVIDWSWWLVASPLLFDAAIFVVALFVLAVVTALD